MKDVVAITLLEKVKFRRHNQSGQDHMDEEQHEQHLHGKFG
jgi:hypothetical protein